MDISNLRCIILSVALPRNDKNQLIFAHSGGHTYAFRTTFMCSRHRAVDLLTDDLLAGQGRMHSVVFTARFVNSNPRSLWIMIWYKR